jgi:4-hydroxyphenylacetate 3-monooxygenase
MTPAVRDDGVPEGAGAVRRDMARFARIRGLTQGFDEFVEQCLSEYDLEGWTSDTWLDPSQSL